MPENDQLQIDTVRIPDLEGMAAPYNPRKISKHDLERLRASMREFGPVVPVVVNRRTKRVVGGHQRIKAARDIGLESLPVVWVDLEEQKEKQLNLALNRISGEWDDQALAELLAELADADQDLELTGFSGTEVDDLINSIAQGGGKTDEDRIPAAPDRPRTRPGDTWQMGKHRLICGDAGDKETLDHLLAGKRADLLVTDPPWNVNVQPGGKPEKLRARDRPLINDNLDPAEYLIKLNAWMANFARALKPGRAFYIWGGFNNIENYPPAIREAGLHFHQVIIWNKEWPLIGRLDFMHNHELIFHGFAPSHRVAFYGWRKGAPHYFCEVRNIPDTWVVKKTSPAEVIHLTEKPVELTERPITYSSRRGELVLDPFAGSGSTLIAVEKTGRRAALLEIDPAYCDVIVTRWQDYTGQEATRNQEAA